MFDDGFIQILSLVLIAAALLFGLPLAAKAWRRSRRARARRLKREMTKLTQRRWHF